MHIDEITRVADGLTWQRDAHRRARAGQLRWTRQHWRISNLACRSMEVTLDSDGHLFVAGSVTGLAGGTEQEALDRLTVWALECYMQILAHWTALHGDVVRGTVRVGQAGVIGAVSQAGLRVRAADVDVPYDDPIPLQQVRARMMTEACRRFVYSTTDQFRKLDRELGVLGGAVTHSDISQAEELSIEANQRINSSRTARARLEIAVQTIHNQLHNHPDAVAQVRRDLMDLVLVAEHMQSVWLAKERNLEWVVQHVNLRVGVAERRATRSFTAAVFAVAVVALIRDVVESSLSVGIIRWSLYRVLAMSLSCVAVVIASYLLYLIIKRLAR